MDLRKRIRTEMEFMKLNPEEREKYRKAYLEHIGYDPEISMRENPWQARLSMYRSHIDLIRDNDFMSFYLENQKPPDDGF